jgi:hypothetical protein
MEYWGAWGTLIHEKNLKSKISRQTPLKVLVFVVICVGERTAADQVSSFYILVVFIGFHDENYIIFLFHLSRCWQQSWVCVTWVRFPDFLATFSGNKSTRLAAGLGDQLIVRLAAVLIVDQLIGRLVASPIMISPLFSPRIPGMILLSFITVHVLLTQLSFKTQLNFQPWKRR